MTNSITTWIPFALFAALIAGCATSDDGKPTAAPAHRDHAAATADHGAAMADHAAMFDRLDADHDGKLTAAELRGADDHHAHMLAEHLAALDLDGDGALDRDELEQHHADFSAMIADHGQPLFDALDADHDGKLSAAELAADPGIGRMIAQHLAEIDGDHDGLLDHAEVAAAIAQHHHGD